MSDIEDILSGDSGADEDVQVEETTEDVIEETQSAESESDTTEEAVEETTEKAQPTVPLAALHEARGMNRELREQLAETQRRLSQFDTLREELKAFKEGQSTSAKAAEEQRLEALKADDPVAYLEERNRQMAAQLEQLTTKTRQSEEAQAQSRTQQEQMQSLYNDIQAQTMDYAKSHPEYTGELQFVLGRWQEDAALLVKPNEVEKVVMAQALAIGKNAIDQGKNPAEVVHQLARNWGYQPQKAAQAKQEDLTKTMERLEKGQSASKTLSGGGSRAKDAELSLADINDMSDDDIDKLFDEMSQSAGKKDIFG